LAAASNQRVGGASEVDETQRFNLLQSLLWLDCHDSCPDCLQLHTSYSLLTYPSRALLGMLLAKHTTAVRWGERDWQTRTLEQLGSEFTVRVECNQAELNPCSRDLTALLVQPVEVGYQFFYPVVDRISRQRTTWTIDLSIRELARSG